MKGFLVALVIDYMGEIGRVSRRAMILAEPSG
jgi:hypothetical protein